MKKIGLISTICLGVLGMVGSLVPVVSASQDVLILLDNSTGMQRIDPENLTKSVVRRFLERQSEHTQVSILLYDDRIVPVAELTPITDNTRKTIIQRLDQLNFLGRHSNSAAALERAIYELKTNGRTEAQKTIVYVSNSAIDTGDKRQDQEFSQWLREILAEEAAQAGIQILAIGLSDAADFQIIQTLAHKTGGTYYRTGGIAELESAFDKIHQRIVTEPTASVGARPQSIATQKPMGQAPAASTLESTQSASTLPAQPGALSTTPETVVPEQRTPRTQSTLAATTTPASRPSMTHKGNDKGWISGHLGLLIILGSLIVIGAVAIVALLVWRGKHKAPPLPAVDTPTSSAYTPPAMLEDTGGITSKQSYDITGKLTWISRAHGEDSATTRTVVVRNDLISRDHAVIQYKNFGYWISDRGSVNGTFVNDQRIADERLLKHGDRVRFAKFEFKFAMPQRDDLAATVYVKAATESANPDQGAANTRELAVENNPSKQQFEPTITGQGSNAEQTASSSASEPEDTAVTDTSVEVRDPAVDQAQPTPTPRPDETRKDAKHISADGDRQSLGSRGDTEEVAQADILQDIIAQSSSAQETTAAVVASEQQAEQAGTADTVVINVPVDGADDTTVANTGGDGHEPTKPDQTSTRIVHQPTDEEERTAIAATKPPADQDTTQLAPSTAPVNPEDHTTVVKVQAEKSNDDTVERRQSVDSKEDKTMIRPRE